MTQVILKFSYLMIKTKERKPQQLVNKLIIIQTTNTETRKVVNAKLLDSARIIPELTHMNFNSELWHLFKGTCLL